MDESRASSEGLASPLACAAQLHYSDSMTPEAIQRALADITAESDPTLKHFKLASLISAVFRERGVELVVVGGSAIEFYTEGAYVSGDLDLCVASAREPLTVRIRQQAMGELGATGGPRSWQVAGAFADVLGEFENLARSAIRHLAGPSGEVCIAPVEELIVERILVSNYPGDLKWTPLLRPRGAIFKLVFGEGCSGFSSLLFSRLNSFGKRERPGQRPARSLLPFLGVFVSTAHGGLISSSGLELVERAGWRPA